MKKTLIFLIIFSAVGIVQRTFAFDLNRVQIHGFASQGYLYSDENEFLTANTDDGTFEFNEFGINFGADLTDSLRMGIQFLSRDLGDFGNNRVMLDWAFGDYRYRNWLGLQAGKMKLAYGFYNQSRDVDAARTNIFLPQGIYSELFRDTIIAITGLGVYGTFPGGVEYQVQYGILNFDLEDEFTAILGTILGADIQDVNPDYIGVATLRWNTPLEGLRIGVSLGDSNNTFETFLGSTELETQFITASVEFATYNWFVSAEYNLNEYSTTQTSGGIAMPPNLFLDTTGEAYYVNLSYRFTDWFEVGSYYSVAYSDKDDKDGKRFEELGFPGAIGWQKDWAVSARFDLNEHWLFKLESHLIDGLPSATSFDLKDPAENWFLFAAKMTYFF